MVLSFPNVSLLGLNQDSRFFGAGFQYASFQRIGIQGLLTDLTQSFGITGTWSGAQGLISTIKNNTDYQDLYLNGISFGSGRVESIDFDAGLDVRTKSYKASILVYNSGNLFNFTGAYYSGVNTANFQFLDSFNEDYAFDRKQNGGYSYTHNASIRFISGAGQLNAIGAAQQVARSLFTGSNLGFAFYSGYTNKQGKRYFTESYNLIDNACDFRETFDFDSDAGNYSALRSNAFELGENGIINVSESATIRGIENPNYQKALSAVGIEMTGAYYRCSGVAVNYYPSGVMLLTTPIVNGRTIDIFSNNIGYNVTFTNDPSNSGTYFWNYTRQINRQDGVAGISEEGTILGRGPDRPTAFANAQIGLGTIRAGIAGRVTSLYSSVIGSSTNFLESKAESYAPYQGQDTYAYRYSNDPSLVSNTGVRRIDISEEDTSSIYQYNKINIFNYKEIAQDGHQSTVGSETLKVTMQGDKTATLPIFLNTALNEINTRLPSGNDTYLLECNYSFAPNEGTVDTNVTWVFNKPAVKTIAL